MDTRKTCAVNSWRSAWPSYGRIKRMAFKTRYRRLNGIPSQQRVSRKDGGPLERSERSDRLERHRRNTPLERHRRKARLERHERSDKSSSAARKRRGLLRLFTAESGTSRHSAAAVLAFFTASAALVIMHQRRLSGGMVTLCETPLERLSGCKRYLLGKCRKLLRLLSHHFKLLASMVS